MVVWLLEIKLVDEERFNQLNPCIYCRSFLESVVQRVCIGKDVGQGKIVVALELLQGKGQEFAGTKRLELNAKTGLRSRQRKHHRS